MSSYQEAVAVIRKGLPSEPSLQDFIRFAMLAPNSHNTQPWKFRLGRNTIDILPDFTRRTPVVDPDDHHLYVTLGCAAENLLIAANANSRPAELSLMAQSDEGVVIRASLETGCSADKDLCAAIPLRQSTRSEYDGRELSETELRQLDRAASMPGVDVIFITERSRLTEALDFIQQGASTQINDVDFVRELKNWIRYNPAAALKTGDGLFGKCSGIPSAPDWLGPILFDLTFRKGAENKKHSKHVRSSAGLAVFAAQEEGPEGWIQVGRSFERFALRATTLGVRHAHLNQPIEASQLRSVFANWLGMPGRRPDLVIRFGKAPPMPMSMRRPVNAVIAA